MIEATVETVNKITSVKVETDGTVGDVLREMAALNTSVIKGINERVPLFDVLDILSVIEEETKAHLNGFQEEQDNV